ncbi:MAG: N-acetyltransferase [Chloroflexi bacterium]|nr:N-acetyltransferase [Chloroflexota bacterium]
MSNDNILIRHAREADLAQINDIYNYYVINTPVTFDFEPVTLEERVVWFKRFAESEPYQLFVAEGAGSVLGYAYSYAFRDRRAYDTTVEFTVYCAHDAKGRGIGTQLYNALFNALEGQDLRLVIAGITLPNEPSVRLHAAFGFEPAGVMHEVGRKFDRFWDVGWFEKRLG